MVLAIGANAGSIMLRTVPAMFIYIYYNNKNGSYSGE